MQAPELRQEVTIYVPRPQADNTGHTDNKQTLRGVAGVVGGVGWL